MGLDFRYGTDATFINSTAISTSRVRLGEVALVENADFGSYGTSGLQFDDTDGTFDMQGLRPFWMDETTATNRRLFTGFLADRKYRRDGNKSLVVDGARVIDATLLDLNAVFKLRVLRAASAKRPAEDVGDRVAWLLTQMSPTIYDNGHVNQGLGRNMGAADYRGLYPLDVLDDCSGGTARNYFAYWDPAAASGQRISLFFNDRTYTGYASSLRISNVLADVDNVTTFYGNVGAELTTDPVTTYSGVYYVYKGGRLYVQNAATAANFIPRDLRIESSVTASRSVAKERAEAVLAERTQEHDNILVTVRLPLTKAGDIQAGHLLDVKFSHFSDYDSGYTSVRVLRRTIIQLDEDPAELVLALECAVPQFLGPSSGEPPGQPPNGDPFQQDCATTNFSNVHDQTTDARLTAWGDDGGTAWLDTIEDGAQYTLAWKFTNGTRDNPANLEYSQKIYFVQSAPTNEGPAKIGWLPAADNTGSGGDALTPGGVQDTGAVQTATGTWTFDRATALANGWNPGDPIWFFGRGGWSPGHGDGGSATLIMTLVGSDDDCNAPEPGQPVPPENAGTGNGTTRCYVTNFPYLPGSLHVTVNGITVVVEETNPETGAWCLSFPPPSGAVINVNYQAASPEGTGGTNPVAPPGGYIQNFPVSTNKGDLIVSDGSNWQKFSGGSNYQILTRDTAFPLGVKWAEPSNGGGGGVSGITSNGSNSLSGAVNLQAGTGIALGVSGQNITITNTGSSGGGGGGSTDAILGQSGQGGAQISGLQGSPDITVGAGSDLEFDSSTLGGTAMGSLTTEDANTTRKGHYYQKKAATSSFGLVGRYWSSPSMPFTATAKLAGSTAGAQFHRTALFVAESTPGKTAGIYYELNTGTNRAISTITSTSPTAGAAYRDMGSSGILVYIQTPLWLRIVVASSTDITFYWSTDGLAFKRHGAANYNPGFTIASVGLCVDPETTTHDQESFWDYLRFT